jgi:hypothetical protein
MPEIKDLLQLPYDRQSWGQLLHEVFPNVSIFQVAQRITDGVPDYVKDYSQLGSVRLADGKHLAVFEVRVDDKVNLIRNRVALRQLVARHIDEGTTHGVLCIFNSSSPEYRFTFVAKESGFNDEGRISTSETTPRRYTYILGPGETRRTAAQRFQELAGQRQTASLKEVMAAFSVERLNKEFFTRYKEHYQAFVDHLIEHTAAPADVFGVTEQPGSTRYDESCKPLRDWVKKLLGRIVFIHFIQKKGWMGCLADSRKWKDGDPQFLLHLFQQCSEKDRFHSACLAPLFFDALNTPDRPGDVFPLNGTRVPYLNGGLFEERVPAARTIDFPADLFKNLLEFFASYNFTIDENDPEEHEVGIDPEMLGHIFENLLEENKDKGAFYTPKSVVQFMCQQALLLYLQTHLGEQSGLENLVRLKDAGENTKENWVRQNASGIEALLDRVTVCDPAIGSGAFPIGMLHEIFWIKLTLDWTLNDPAKFADIKRRIIEHSIHGVDIDPGAVEIARLRCWLSLIVDEVEPRPLPNLEFKIHCANSLIEYLRGEPVNLSHFAATDPRSQCAIEDLMGAKQRLFEATRVPEKRAARLALYSALIELGQIEFAWMRNQADQFDERVADLQKLLLSLNKLGSELESATKLSAKQQDQILGSIEKWFSDSAKPTFAWRLYFGEVFVNGGFDITIANPPYLGSATTDNKELLENRYQTYDRSGDIYICFYELALGITRVGGGIAFITSNQFFRADYGMKLRDMIARSHTNVCIHDVSTTEVFKVAAYPAIIILQNGPSVQTHVKVSMAEEMGNPPISSLTALAWNSVSIPKILVNKDRWLPVSEEKVRLLNKLLNKENFPSLGDVSGLLMRRGILTGYDTAFILNEAKRLEIINDDPACEAIIHPILQGRCLKRWSYDSESRYVLFTQRGINIEQYPGALKYLRPMRSRLEPGVTGGRKNGPYKWFEIQDSCAYASLFSQPKIAWGNLATFPSFCTVPENVFLKEPCPFIVGAEPWLLALLNSSICHFVVHYTAAIRQGGFREYKPVYLSRFPVPRLSPKLASELSRFARTSVQSGLGDDYLLNELVLEAYELSPTESDILLDFVNNVNNGQAS